MLLRRLIGTVLRRARLAQGRSLRDVAEAARVSLPYLSEIERGLKEPSSEVLAAICEALGLTLTDLVEAVHEELARLTPTMLTAPSSAQPELSEPRTSPQLLARGRAVNLLAA